MSERAKRTLGLGAIVTTGAALLLLFVVLLAPRTVPPAVAQALQAAPLANGLLSDGADSAPLVWLIRAGYQPDALAAGGGSNEVAAAVLHHLADHQNALNALSVMKDQRDAKAEMVAHINAQLWRGGSSPERLAELQVASSQLAVRRAEYDQKNAQLQTAVDEFLTNSVGADGVAVSDRFRLNRDRRVPDAFKALDLDDEAWSTLESAYIKLSHNYSMSGDEASLLAQCENHPLSILVASRLASNAPAIGMEYDQNIAQMAQDAMP